MIRFVEKKDIKEITALYNKYIVEGVETFETETLTEKQMADRVEHIAALRKTDAWLEYAMLIRGRSAQPTATLMRQRFICRPTSLTAALAPRSCAA